MIDSMAARIEARQSNIPFHFETLARAYTGLQQADKSQECKQKAQELRQEYGKEFGGNLPPHLAMVHQNPVALMYKINFQVATEFIESIDQTDAFEQFKEDRVTAMKLQNAGATSDVDLPW